jgi:hypothetical protein
MRPERWRTGALLAPRRDIEGQVGVQLLYEEPKGWGRYLEMLGSLCVEAWYDELLEEDSDWASAHREKFKRWTKGLLSNEINTEGHPGSGPSTQQSFDELLVLPWAMALEAVRSALFFAFRDKTAALEDDGEPVDRDPAMAWHYRLECKWDINSRRLIVIVKSAAEGYLASSDGLFYGEPEPRPTMAKVSHGDSWLSFAERVEDAPEGESELETAEAAAREFWDARYKEPPPWEGDRNQIHWLAAVRAVREAATTYVPPQR